MASQYPSAFDTLTTTLSNSTAQLNTHPQNHNDANDAINKMQRELGVNPSAGESDLATRLDTLSTDVAAAGSAGAPLLAPTTSTRNTIQPSAAAAPALILKGHASQSADLFKIVASDDSERLTIDNTATTIRYTAPNIFGGLSMRLVGDTQDRLVIGPNTGTILFGPGGSTAPDTSFFRQSEGRLQTPGRMRILCSPGAGAGYPGHLEGLYVGASDPTTGYLPSRFTNIFSERQYRRTDPPILYESDGVTPRPQAEWAYNVTYSSISSLVNYGSYTAGVAAQGSGFGVAASQVINHSQNTHNEFGVYYGALRYENGSIGNAWFTDWTVHGSTNQVSTLSGVNMHMNNNYNGQPTGSPSVAYTASTWPARGGSHSNGAPGETEPAGTPFTADRTTYPMAYGFHCTGRSGSPVGAAQNAGWNVGFKVGGEGVWCDNGRLFTGMDIEGHINYGIRIHTPSSPSAGFKSIQVETGGGEAVFNDGLAIPGVIANRQPVDGDRDNDLDGQIILDNVRHRLYVRSGGVYRYVTLTAG